MGGSRERWTGGSVRLVDGGRVDRWDRWTVDQWIGGTGGRWDRWTVDRWTGGTDGRWTGGTGGRWTGGPVDRWDRWTVDRWDRWTVDRWTGGTGGQWTGGPVGPVDSGPVDGAPSPVHPYLLTRFDDEIVKQKQIGFEQALLSYADRYVKEHIKGKQTEREKEESKKEQNEERDRLIECYISEMRRLAETKIYGYNSVLLESELFQEKLTKAKENMNRYREPDAFMEAVQNFYDTGISNDQEILSTETREKLNKLLDRILREKRINDSIDPEAQRELQVELEQCPKRHHAAGTVNLVHAK